MKAIRLFIAVLGTVFLLAPNSQAAANHALELGEVLGQNIRPIDGSPFFLEERDGQTFLHDVPSDNIVPILSEQSLLDHGDRIASTDGQEFVSVSQATQERLRVTKQGHVSSFTFEDVERGVTLKLVAYDASRDVAVWKDTSTHEVVITDLKGAISWRVSATSRADVILAASTDEVLTRQGKVLTRYALESGNVKGTVMLPVEPREVRAETSSDLLFMPFGHLYVYDIAKAELERINVEDGSLYSLTPVVAHKGKFYGNATSRSLIEIDVANKQIDELRLSSHATYSLLQGGVMLQLPNARLSSDVNRAMSLDRVRMIPTDVVAWPRALTETGKGNYWFGEAYQLLAEVRTSGGETVTGPLDDLGVELSESTRTFASGYTVPSLDGPFSYKVKLGWLTSKWGYIVPTKKLPLQIDTSFTNGAVGDITGTTAPNTNVYLSCEKEVYAKCSGMVKSDSTGRFIFSNGIVQDNQTVTIWAANDYDYHNATEATVKQSFRIDTPPVQIGPTVLTKTSMEGVTIQSTPHAKIEVRQLVSSTSFKATEVTADASGVARLTSYKSGDPLYYTIFYRVKDGTSPYHMIRVFEDYPMPEVIWTKAPKTGDVSITVQNKTLAPLLTVYRNGRMEVTKPLAVGTNVVTLKEPLLEGQTIKVIASFRPELSKTFEQKVTSDAPMILNIKDVLVSSTSSTLTVLKDGPSYLNFIVNGKPISYTEVGKDRYRIEVRPGTSVVVQSSIGSKRKQVTYVIPATPVSPLAPTDEVSVWKGKTFPNATVTLKAGTTILASAKANSTGDYQLRFARQRAGTKLTFEAKAGVAREVKTATVKAGVTPTVSAGTIRSTTKTVAIRTNVPYGTVTIYNGKTLVAKKTIVSTTTNVTIKPQKRGSKLTIKIVTPANRSAQIVKTVL